jgi:hypothetical protein
MNGGRAGRFGAGSAERHGCANLALDDQLVAIDIDVGDQKTQIVLRDRLVCTETGPHDDAGRNVLKHELAERGRGCPFSTCTCRDQKAISLPE